MPLRTKHIYYAGGKLLGQEWGANLIVFLYDESGMPIGMHYRTSGYSSGTWDAYWFERNLHGDVVAIYNNSNVKLASYRYDAWGNHTVTYHNGGGSLTAIVNNPIRYRGYYYDVDLGLYYLQSRYYDSNIGRFINADSALYHDILGYNMYAYCNNNPVMFVDPYGESAVETMGIWLETFVPVALIEPTPIGEVILGLGVVAIGVVIVIEFVANAVTGSLSRADEAPKSVTEEESPELDENGHPVVKPGQQPTEKEGYIAPKGGPKWNKEKKGWEDKNGNVWVPVPTGSGGAHPSGHWDVQSPKGGYKNVFPGGRTSGGKKPYPIFPTSLD